ncbi:MAG: DegT/DnrJ/EryC1/StrS family aminotransferase, partial [Planctomycetota bacterium]
AEIDEVNECLRSGWLGTGPRVAAFERAFAEYKRTQHAVAVGSCTAALHLSIVAADLEPGDEVITTAMTFCATVNAIVNAGGVPVLCDVEPDTMNIDPEAVEAAITPRTRAILVVHFAGRSCAMDRILAIAEKHDLQVIEDCAHAIETTFRGRPAGTMGDFGCFSFYATKNITTGEGGMVIAAAEDLAARIKRLALHGMTADAWKRFGDEGFRHYFVDDRGFKCNMMDLQAAIGIHQLARVEEHWRWRDALWQAYSEALAELPVQGPAGRSTEEELAPGGSRHGLHLYTVLVEDRDAVLDAMTKDGIGLGVHYLAIPEHPFYRRAFGWEPDAFPVATSIGRRTLSLPLSPGLTESDQARVIASLGRALARD